MHTSMLTYTLKHNICCQLVNADPYALNHKICVKIKGNWNINLHSTKKKIQTQKGTLPPHFRNPQCNTVLSASQMCVSLSPSLLKWQKQDPIPNLTPKQQRNPPGLIILCLGSVLALLSYPLPLFLSFILSLSRSLSVTLHCILSPQYNLFLCLLLSVNGFQPSRDYLDHALQSSFKKGALGCQPG